ncbi:MAG: histidine kinase [Deltaproteobacteria bacterium]|nr:MAG: histidine kinase [Deltaproteobacteria bacterium]
MVTAFIGLVLILGSSWGYAADAGAKEEAVAMVKKGIDYIKANGRAKAFAEFTNPQGKFRDRSLYLVVSDMNAKILAHGQNKDLVGMNMMDYKDVDGKEVMKERVALMKAHKTAWQNYKFINPATNKIEPKQMYLERYEDLVIACGVYKK